MCFGDDARPAPHSSFDRSFAEHRQACDRAWQAMLESVERCHTGSPAVT